MWNVDLPDAEWITPDSPRLPAIIAEVCGQKEIAIDTETTGLVVYRDIPLFWSLSWGHRRLCMPSSTLPYFSEAFKDPTKEWIFANAKFDLHMLANVGVHIAGRCLDVAVMHTFLYEEDSHALKDMAKQVLGWRWKDFFDQFKPKLRADGKREEVGDMLLRAEKEDLKSLVEYASNDAFGTMQLKRKLEEELKSAYVHSLYPETYDTLWDLFAKMEVPFTKVLWKCERNGFYVNQEYLSKIRIPVEEELDYIHRQINHLAGRVFNPRSTLDVGKYFFGQLKLQPRTYTKGGKSGVKVPSVDSGFLEHYAEEGVEMCKLMLRQRDLAKTLGTYVNGLSREQDQNGRVHTRFNQTPRTGRISSSSPNLQNVKRPDEDEFKLRGAFQPQAGTDNVLIFGDYEQLEMRLLACASLEPDMIQIFRDGKDIHMGNAALVFGSIYEKKYNWPLTYEDIVSAKKTDKKVKNGELGPEAMDWKVQQALYARQAAKSIGFG